MVLVWQTDDVRDDDVTNMSLCDAHNASGDGTNVESCQNEFKSFV